MVPLESLIKCLTILCCSRCIAVHLKVGTCARGLCILSAFRSVSVEICCNWSWVWFLLIIDFGTLRTHHFKNTGHYIGNCHWPVFSLGGSHHMYKVTNLCKFELNRSSKLLDNNVRKKTPLSHEVVCFQMLDLETSNSKLEVSKSNSWKNTSFSKTTLLQREPFLTMCFTINSSPLLASKVLC